MVTGCPNVCYTMCQALLLLPLLLLRCVSITCLSLPLSYVYTVNALYFFLVSSVDVGLVDLNHFSHNTTPRCSVKNSSRFTLFFPLSLSLFLHMQCKREREREGMNWSLEAHIETHFRIYYSSSHNDGCAYVGWSLLLMLVVPVVIVVSAL